MIGPATYLLSPSEVAEALHGVSLRTVEGWIANQEIASFKKGKNRLISLESLTVFVQLNTVRARRPDWFSPDLEDSFLTKVRQIGLERMIQIEVSRQLSVVSGQRDAA